MALVMLPSDLPWWDSVKRLLKKIAETKNSSELIDKMQKIYEMCNVSLEPDEESIDPHQFAGFMNFLDNDLTNEERSTFFSKTLPNLATRALKIKECRPKNGLHFSLQQQADSTELDYTFVSSLVANAFFSTFPKRTDKTHPTLQNFNFADFFKSLNHNTQKSKLKSLLYYFEWLANNENSNGKMKILRQVMSSKEWLTIEDWVECSLPLCSIKIRHDGKLNRTEEDCLQICFSSAKIGGNVLGNGFTQECINLVTAPELLTILLNVEALEDNEVLTVENVRHISRMVDPKHRAFLEKFDSPRELSVCCIDAEDYTKLPIGQYEEDNILRELNKCLLGFQQKQLVKNEKETPFHLRRRLSPIGESMGSNQSDCLNIPLITQQSCSTTHSGSISPIPDNNNLVNDRLCVQLEMEKNLQKRNKASDSLVHGRRGRFIVLGSSGECLPITRKPYEEESRSEYDSCESSEGEFHSAKTSVDDGDEDENFHKRYSIDLETPERRNVFAQRLRDALRKEITTSTPSTSEESSYAVGISVMGSNLLDRDIRVRRGGSTGFALKEDSMDDNFLENSLNQEKEWIDKFRNKQSSVLNRKESNKSSEYSFSTEYSSELEEVYEQFSRWLESPMLETEKGTKRELDARELAVVRFAGSILKRTLSESFVGVPVPMTENCDIHSCSNDEYSTRKNKLVLNAKSLSLELARQKHRLAAQLTDDKCCDTQSRPVALTLCDNEDSACSLKKSRNWFITCVTEAIVQNLEDVSVSIRLQQTDDELSQISEKPKNGLKPISTGNWGCGSSHKGDVQLKVIIQWMAASVAGVPALIYCTYGHQQLAKLDTVCRILIDRKWTVRDLAEAALRYSNRVIQGKELSGTLFEELIGMERTV
uniref:poly(ADP-ribose) glycohydrolase n=1 Tax=Diabrotica virgifera virgifera TaxID=50390 RepID=A0A6P7FKF7_DIAVI